MARSRTRSIEAQIRALADVFIQGITQEEADAILARGPSALAGACFRWAWDAASQVEAVPAVDPTRSASLEAHAPVVTRLEQLAFERFVRRFGEPQAPPLPEAPEDLDVEVCIHLDPDDHRRMGPGTKPLCRTAVYSPCMSSQSDFYFTRDRDTGALTLWVQWEDGESYGRFNTPAAWTGARPDLSDRDAALLLLEAYWRRMQEAWHDDRPNEIDAQGETITQDELLLLAERVWG